MDRMKIAEVRKLAKALPLLLERFGAVPSPHLGEGVWLAYSDAGRCHLSIHPYLDLDNKPFRGHPWLACCFRRPAGVGYADLRKLLDANPYSGKYNCHIFENVSAAWALDQFEIHLRSGLGRDPRPLAAVPVKTRSAHGS